MAINFTVIVKNDELEKALKKMKTKSIKSGLVLEMRQRRYFEKGSDKRIRKAKEMLINTKKKKRLRERDL
jgi:small subunit ribosomal protein S21